ncbi:hypothetical protein F4780DRAFT_784263 [Xylariomycetidae sp. FL0641]|nr:hypothetical protein F4780DRAFT_784263 [Xylariomycetidae sp. FL0641]
MPPTESEDPSFYAGGADVADAASDLPPAYTAPAGAAKPEPDVKKAESSRAPPSYRGEPAPDTTPKPTPTPKPKPKPAPPLNVPLNIKCPFCDNTMTTRIKKRLSGETWVVGTARTILFAVCWPVMCPVGWVMLCCGWQPGEEPQDTSITKNINTHFCAKCGRKLARQKDGADHARMYEPAAPMVAAPPQVARRQ